MSWDDAFEAEWAELMSDYAQMLPAIERAVRFEDRLDDIERRITELEESARNPLLESIKKAQKER